MVLTRIKSSRIGFELRSFQGVNCDHVDKVVTETKSMKWISSGLQAPAVGRQICLAARIDRAQKRGL